MATLLDRPRQTVETSTHQTVPSSPAEQEMLALLGRPARYPPSLRDIQAKLLPFFSLLEIQKALLTLLEAGLIVAVYTSGSNLGFTLTKN